MFHNIFSNYIGRTMNYRNRGVCAVKEYKDPITDYEENKIPKDIPRGETSEVRKLILYQKVKSYVRK